MLNKKLHWAFTIVFIPQVVCSHITVNKSRVKLVSQTDHNREDMIVKTKIKRAKLKSVRHWQRWGAKPLGQCSLIHSGWSENREVDWRLLASRQSGTRIAWYGQHM